MRVALRCLASLAVVACTSAAALAAGDTYVITDGKGAVSTVTTSTAGGTTVAPGDNSSTKADGTISAATKGKHAGQLCFHGTLNGTPDPDPNGIGWGVVTKSPADGGIVDNYVKAAGKIQISITVLLEMDKNCDALDTADAQIQGTIDAMGDVYAKIGDAVTAGTITAKVGDGLKATVQELTDLLAGLQADVATIGTNKPTSFDDLLKKLAPFRTKGKKVNKLMKDIAKHLAKAGIFK